VSNTVFDPVALEDVTAFAKNEPKLLKKIFDLIADIHKHPFEGLGKPEGLKHQFKGCWSRRITDEHRLIYKVLPGGDIYILSVYGHYSQ
jgi:toxin YoeB